MTNFMLMALKEAKHSEIDIPVGAVLVKNGKVLAKSHNKREKNFDISAHAEILALKKAGKKLGNWRLDGCEMYVTLEPCPMCAWAILQSRLKAVYFGSYDKISGAYGSACDVRNLAKTNIKVYGGIEEDLCDNVINEFWKIKRQK